MRASLPAARRVPGLRRDELAGIAGVSEEHLKRLEQGRRRPSPAGPSVFETPERLDGFRVTVVGELREAAHRYPPTPGGHADRLRVPSPNHGHLYLDLDVLTLNPGDLRVVVYTARA